MATIRATCNDCGDVEVTSGNVQVVVSQETNQGSYNFVCPVCRMRVSKPAEPRTVDLLIASGVNMRTTTLPQEAFEILQLNENAPITHDDLLDVHNLLEDDDAFELALKGLNE